MQEKLENILENQTVTNFLNSEYVSMLPLYFQILNIGEKQT